LLLPTPDAAPARWRYQARFESPRPSRGSFDWRPFAPEAPLLLSLGRFKRRRQPPRLHLDRPYRSHRLILALPLTLPSPLALLLVAQTLDLNIADIASAHVAEAIDV
tara:strand:- start:437 stop:757 length:321 start_codon:yes stop_codon:yes gene_type:complete